MKGLEILLFNPKSLRRLGATAVILVTFWSQAQHLTYSSLELDTWFPSQPCFSTAQHSLSGQVPGALLKLS